MELALRGLGDAQADCNATKLLQSGAPGIPCTPAEMTAYVNWKAGATADIAQQRAAQAIDPSSILIGALGWATPSRQIDYLLNGTPKPPLLFYVGAALPFVALYFLFGKGK